MDKKKKRENKVVSEPAFVGTDKNDKEEEKLKEKA